MKLTGEDRSTRGKTCPSATLSTTNLTWTIRGLGMTRGPIGRQCIKNLAVYPPDSIGSTFTKTRPPVACEFTTQRVVYK
jgi:hypothetical protein